jgi:hypothetical protein
MHIVVQVPDEVRRAAEERQIPVIDLIEAFMAHGMRKIKQRPAVLVAIERIRALRSSQEAGQRG